MYGKERADCHHCFFKGNSDLDCTFSFPVWSVRSLLKSPASFNGASTSPKTHCPARPPPPPPPPSSSLLTCQRPTHELRTSRIAIYPMAAAQCAGITKLTRPEPSHAEVHITDIMSVLGESYILRSEPRTKSHIARMKAYAYWTNEGSIIIIGSLHQGSQNRAASSCAIIHGHFSSFEWKMYRLVYKVLESGRDRQKLPESRFEFGRFSLCGVKCLSRGLAEGFVRMLRSKFSQ